MKVIGLRLLFLALILLAWQITAQRLPPGLFATPLATLSAASRLLADGELTTALLASLRVYLLGTISAGIVGIAVGVLMGVVRPLGHMLDVFVYALAAAGEAGVANMLDLVAKEMRVAMALTGCADLAGIGPHVIWRAPPG